MSPRHDDEATSRHGFFHAMVVMGGSLALGCGGATSGDSDSGGSAGAAVTSSGGSASGGAPAATGGTTSSGGSSGGGEVIVVSTGGRTDPGSLPCPPAQFACPLDPIGQCRGGDYELPGNCTCDAQRPASALDCAPEQSFVCRRATVDRDGVPLASVVGFDCRCLPKQVSCSAACDTAFSYLPGASCFTAPQDPNSILCGCAVIVLR